MRVLVAFDVDTRGEGNPYVFQLLQALERHSTVEGVQHGTGWLRTREVNFDLIHIQWPEALNGWAEPSRQELQELAAHLEWWGGQGGIVVTAHNKYPHGRDTPAFQELYRLVYEHADGVIHLGECSKSVVRQRYSRELSGKHETVIRHGQYSWFPNSVSRREARNRLDLPERARVILCFGQVRRREEARLLLKGFAAATIPNKRLLITGLLPYPSRRRVYHYCLRIPFWIRPTVQLAEQYIPASRVQLYLRAADVLVIPRTDGLNSGDVALGLTFGVPIVGPEFGVIGEMLRATDNPTYDPTSIESVASALERAASASPEKTIENTQYAKRHLNWSLIGDQHVSFYEQVLGSRQVDNG